MGQIATRYRRRAANVGRQNALLRGAIGKTMVEALQQATDEELYERTPLETSGKMRRSIQVYYLGNAIIEVGYDLSRAPHAKRRLNLKGTSPTGGHLLDMRPAPIVRRVANPSIAVLNRAALRRALNVI